MYYVFLFIIINSLFCIYAYRKYLSYFEYACTLSLISVWQIVFLIQNQYPLYIFILLYGFLLIVAYFLKSHNFHAGYKEMLWLVKRNNGGEKFCNTSIVRGSLTSGRNRKGNSCFVISLTFSVQKKDIATIISFDTQSYTFTINSSIFNELSFARESGNNDCAEVYRLNIEKKYLLIERVSKKKWTIKLPNGDAFLYREDFFYTDRKVCKTRNNKQYVQLFYNKGVIVAYTGNADKCTQHALIALSSFFWLRLYERRLRLGEDI